MIALNTQLTLLPPADPAPAAATIVESDPSVGRAAQLIALWLADNKAQTTRKTYTEALADFQSFIDEPSIPHAVARLLLSKATAKALITAYAATMTTTRKLSPATVSLRLAALRSLLAMASEIDLVDWTIRIRSPKVETLRDTRGPGVPVVSAMLDVARGQRGAKGTRTAAIVRLLFDVALRRQEVASLDFEHYDAAGGRLAVLGKGKLQRSWITLPAETRAAIDGWLRFRGKHDGPLFVSLSNRGGRQRLSGHALYLIVVKVGELLLLCPPSRSSSATPVE